MIRILCISDEIDPLVYSNNIKSRYGNVDLVLSCGDLPFNYFDFIVSSLNVPLFYVLGNHPPPMKPTRDMLWQENTPPGCINLDNKVVKYKNLILGGFEGSIRYNNDRWSKQYTNFEMQNKIRKTYPRLLWNRLVHKRAIDILITHAPPLGIHDREDPCHKGFAPFLGYMKHFAPRYLIHGHVHLYDRNETWRSRYLATEVINTYGARVIEFED